MVLANTEIFWSGQVCIDLNHRSFDFESQIYQTYKPIHHSIGDLFQQGRQRQGEHHCRQGEHHCRRHPLNPLTPISLKLPNTTPA